MGRQYASELSELAQTYVGASTVPVPRLTAAIRHIESGPVVFIGTGGTSALASFAADEHMSRSGRVAVAMTPLAFVSNVRTSMHAPIVFFSARARHPDIAVAANAAQARSTGPTILVTQRDVADLDPALSASFDEIVTVPSMAGDGFLATNSLVAMATSWLAAAGYDLPTTLHHLKAPSADSFLSAVRRIVVLHAAEHRLAALDLESRLSESGITSVQVTDLRNMAHGRHFGLSQNGQETALVVLVGPEGRDLAERTTRLLPGMRQVLTLGTAHHFPVGAIDCLVGGMQLFGGLATQRGIDPGRPDVPEAGRKLYRLQWASPSSDLNDRRSAAIRRKLFAADLSPAAQHGTEMYALHLGAWLADVAKRRVRSVVLDYDGTCCTTAGRLEPLTVEVTTEVLRLLDAGMEIGFCSGRGRSLHQSLRTWIPPSLWHRVQIGMYNGGVIQCLDDEVEPRRRSEGLLAELSNRLSHTLAETGWTITGRAEQVTIDCRGLVGLPLATVENIVRSVVAADAGNTHKVHVSGHSLDVVPKTSSKINIIESLQGHACEIIAIGDRGELGGNDFELLATVGIGLSVDQVSADPDRCWNIAPPRRRGPEVLIDYLRAIRFEAGYANLRTQNLL